MNGYTFQPMNIKFGSSVQLVPAVRVLVATRFRGRVVNGICKILELNVMLVRDDAQQCLSFVLATDIRIQQILLGPWQHRRSSRSSFVVVVLLSRTPRAGRPVTPAGCPSAWFCAPGFSGPERETFESVISFGQLNRLVPVTLMNAVSFSLGQTFVYSFLCRTKKPNGIKFSGWQYPSYVRQHWLANPSAAR